MVYDITGRKIAVLQDAKMGAGVHEVVWDGKNYLGEDVGSGVYLYQLRAEKFVGNGKMVLVR